MVSPNYVIETTKAPFTLGNVRRQQFASSENRLV